MEEKVIPEELLVLLAEEYVDYEFETYDCSEDDVYSSPEITYCKHPACYGCPASWSCILY